MSLTFLKSSFIHPFLFALFPILLVATSNLNEVIFQDVLFSLLITIGITLAFLICLNLIIKNKLKSSLFVSLGLLIFFTYQLFLSYLASFNLDVSNLPFSYHTFSVPIYFILLVSFTVAIIQIKKYLHDITTFLNIISIVVVVMLFSSVLTYSIETSIIEPLENPLNYQIPNKTELTYLPNIYYIILDEYTSSEILKKIYDFDNDDFLSKLEERGFLIPEESYTNYATSTLSISSNLNMDYVDENIIPTFDNKNELYNNNQIMRILQSLDYEIVTMSLEFGYPEISHYHLCPPALFVNQFHNTLLDISIWQPFAKFFVTAGEPQRDRVNCKFNELANMHNSVDSPYFVFAHIMSPHPPYLFESNGEPHNPEFLSIGADSWSDKPAYVNQLQYVNKKTIETIDKILSNNQKSIIVVQGDHGTPTLLGGGGLRWTNVNNDSITERMSIFNAYYLPDFDSDNIVEGITPVNSFRIILNNYFNGNYEILDNVIYFSTYQDSLNFTDVTELLIQK